MKLSLYPLLIVLSLILLACKKDDHADPAPQPAPPATQQGLEGRWRWIITKGGLTGTQFTPADTGEEMFWEMGPGNTCRIIANNVTVVDAFYTTTSDSSLIYNNLRDIITIQTPPDLGNPYGFDMRFLYQLRSDTLLIEEDVYDGFSHVYVRQ